MLVPNIQTSLIDQRASFQELLKNAKFSVVIPEKQIPYIKLEHPITREDAAKIWRRIGGAKENQQGILLGSAAILASTSKMNCWSFSLPGGPLEQGGACPASILGWRKLKASGKDERGRVVRLDVLDSDVDIARAHSGYKPKPKFICNNCYAINGEYGHMSVFLKQLLVFEWCRQAVEEGSFVDIMFLAIERANEQTKESIKKKGISYTTKKKGKVVEVFNNDPAYFRIHDAGDFWSLEYMQAWFEICRKLPQVKFWTPTRTWVYPEFASMLEKAPANLSVRPSMLHVGDEPQVVLKNQRVASSTVETVARSLERGIFPCPAYAQGTGTCYGSTGPTGGPCRACWDDVKLPVSYNPHSGALRAKE